MDTIYQYIPTGATLISTEGGRTLATARGENISVTHFGAMGDAVKSITGVATAGDATFTDANAAFVAGDVGKMIVIGTAGASGEELTTTIAAVNSATSIELATPAITTVAEGARYAYGTDSFAAFDAALAIGGQIVVPPGNYLLSAPLQCKANTKLKLDPGASLYKAHRNSFLINGRGFDGSSDIPAYSGHGNITIEGGVWEGFAAGIFDGYTGFAIGFATKVRVRDVTLNDMIASGHGVDLTCSSDVLFEGCTFKGWAQNGRTSGQGEIIQLDHNFSTLSFPYFGLSKPDQNKNVTFRSCCFGPNPENMHSGFGAVDVAIGSHGSIHGFWIEGVTIEDCDFEGGEFAAVRGWKWNKAKVVNNRFRNQAGRAIHFTATPAGAESSRDENGVQQNQSQASSDVLISGNSIEDCADNAILFADVVFGTDTSVRHENVRVFDNCIKNCALDAIDMREMRNVIVACNEVENAARLLVIDGAEISSGVVISNNQGRTFTNDSAALAVNTIEDFSIEGNSLRDMNGRAILVSQKSRSGSIDGNSLTDHGLTRDRRCIDIVDQSEDISVSGNKIAIFSSTATLEDIYASATTTRVSIEGRLSNTGNTPVFNGSTSGVSAVIGSGTPEQVVTSQVGSTFRRTNGSAGTTLYIKESGTGSTGWVAK